MKVKTIRRLRRIKERLKDVFVILMIFFVMGALFYGFDLMLRGTGYRVGGVEESKRVISASVGLLMGEMRILENPTYNEMCEFLEDDKTDLHPYLPWYVCEDFAKDVIKNAKVHGIKVGYVEIRTLDGSGHAIVAFNTIDRGLFFLEPQLDVLFSEEEMMMMIREGGYFIAKDYGLYYEYFNFVPVSYTIDWSYIG